MNIKKSISFFAVTIFAAGLIAGCGGGGEKKASPAPEKIIKAGCTGVSYPDSFKENGKLTGYDVEILELAAKTAAKHQVTRGSVLEFTLPTNK